MIHDFNRSLDMSHGWSDAPWWKRVYDEAFPTMTGMRLVNQDGWAQRGGIDRLIDLADGTTLKIDEKVRAENWPDILLEVWSDEDKKAPGWAHRGKHLTCDFIAYAMVPTETCYLLPYQLLRRALKQHGNQWLAASETGEPGYRVVRAKNNTNGRKWRTYSIVVPTAELLEAISDATVVRWGRPLVPLQPPEGAAIQEGLF